MKIFNKILTIGALALIGACEPIEDREILTNSYDPDNIELIATQTADGTGNGITLKMNTPGVTGYWDYKLNKGLTDEVSFISPFMGNVTFTYTISSPYIPNGNLSQKESITKEITVNIQVADQPVPQAYKDLVGDDLQAKTWVFDGSQGSGKQWWFMSDPANPWGQWWNAGDCCAPPDAAGKMVFDLNGSANYTYHATDGSAGTEGTFTFNATYSKLFIGGGLNLLGAGSSGSGNANGEYTIVELTADKLVLHTGTNGAGTGWTWVFVPAP
jgi:hypothetical protein